MYEKTTQINRQNIATHPLASAASRQISGTKVSWTDVSFAHAKWFWTLDNSLQVNSYDVDEVSDRRVFCRPGRQGIGMSPECPAVENRVRLPRNTQCVGDTRRFSKDCRGNEFGIDASKRIRPMKRYRLKNGQALLEFAILIPLFLILIGAVISFGLFFYQGNVLQQAVDVGAQEISRMPFLPDQELGLGNLNKCNLSDLVCDDDDFKAQIYDEQFLVIPDSAWDGSSGFNNDFQAYVDTLPLLNRLLVPAMIRDASRGLTRYPGALVTNNDGELTVLIPLVEYNYNGVVDGFHCSGETIVEWVAPVEEIRVDHDADASTPDEGPYRLVSSTESANDIDSFTRGMVAIRINYPAQATTLINRTDLPPASNPEGKRGQVIVVANDEILDDGDTGCYQLVVNDSPIAGNPADPFGGRYGLGSLGVLKGRVRPFRKVMTFQAIYRREVYANE